ncbi:MAG: DUF3943 domain-containing protein [Oligoflexales bacterium]|nr:DUF3943 domain-containing protein [Oligoflexales bacterium]
MKKICLLLLSFISFKAYSEDRMPSFESNGAEISSPDYHNLGIQSLYLGGLSIAAMSTLWLLPPEQSQWYDKPNLSPKGFYLRWHENVTSGPVWDGDIRWFNGYGHIHAGAAYTVMCLNNGLSPSACTIYANLVSFAWEYGAEAIVELPSIQDILMTGMIGARVGIEFFRWQNAILADSGRLLNSSFLGGLTLFLLNPFGSMFKLLPGIKEGGSTRQTVSVPFFSPPRSNSPAYWGYSFMIPF